MRQFLLITGFFLLIQIRDAYCKDCNDSIAKKIYYEAFSNNSTSPDYVVFIAVDMQTRMSKEICCESHSLIKAFREDNTSDSDTATFLRSYRKAIDMYDSILISQSCDYSFYFKTTSSLEKIGFYNYNSDSVEYYAKQASFIIDSIKEQYNPDKSNLPKDYIKNENLFIIHNLSLVSTKYYI
jgi:hypothetical protein